GRVAAYSDILDCVAILGYNPDFLRELALRKGSRLIAVNYYSKGAPDDGLQSAGDLAQRHHLGGDGGVWRRPFGEGVAGTGAGLDGVGFLVAVDGDAIVLVALGVAAGEREGGVVDGEGAEPGQEVVGVEPGGVE